MRVRLFVAGLIAPLCMAAAVAAPLRAATAADAAGPASDAVVVAVIDGRLNPYHWDFLAAHTPQSTDGDPANDLPLHSAPHTWLPGFPDPASFTSYRPIPLKVDASNPDRDATLLANDDADAWSSLDPSSRSAVAYHWIPDTKVVGVLDFAANGVRGSNDAHGTHVASVSVGNMHGTCPECVLVFLAFDTQDQAESALEWALAQPWIDLVVNSYGFSSTGRYRDRIYNGSDVEAQRTASERGQTIFFSAGNGLENDFRLPNTTYFSSQEGPDWTVTVGAVAPDGHSYSGSGKPVDVASIGNDYPASGGTTVAGAGTFGGTSNATPVVAGIYAHALSYARSALAGPSRVQSAGVVAVGEPLPCGEVRPDCELGDGALTAPELRTRLLSGAIRTPQGMQIGEDETYPPAEPAEADFASEGFGTFFARSRPSDYGDELGRVLGPMTGAAPAPTRSPAETDWFVVDSYCRQQIWGTWSGGAWSEGDPLPLPDPNWPVRTATAASCAALLPPPPDSPPAGSGSTP